MPRQVAVVGSADEVVIQGMAHGLAYSGVLGINHRTELRQHHDGTEPVPPVAKVSGLHACMHACSNIPNIAHAPFERQLRVWLAAIQQ